MKSSRTKRVAAAVLVASGLAIAIPAIGQKQTPESLLPPGFGDPAPSPAPSQAAPAQSAPSQPTAAAGQPASLLPPSLATDLGNAAAGDDLALDNETEGNSADPYDLPPEARRDARRVGVLSVDEGSLGEQAWGGTDGQFLARLMRSMHAPVASRWASILLRRALLSRTAAPRGVDGADWTAERAWLLLRMGEADPARMLVAGIDVDRFNSRLFDIAMQTALATGDPAALCPLTQPVAAYSKLVSWDLARAMCSAMEADPGSASAVIDAVRRGGAARGVDLLLAEKVVGAGANGRRAINIQWDGVNQLTAWRFGLANATGVAIPDPLFDTVGPHVRAWQARSPMIDPAARLPFASWAATLGVFSSAAYADLYGAVFDSGDTGTPLVATAETLRQAFTADGAAARVAAMRSLWDEPTDARERFARLILTARAAAYIAPDPALQGDAARLIESMMTAGYDITAARWAEQANAEGGDAWALLAVGAPARGAVTIDGSRARTYADAQDDDHKARGQFLIAALAGLGRLSNGDIEALAADYRVPVGRVDKWTQAIDAAARARQPGTVALLVAVGMQTREWKSVPPAYLYHMVRALRAVGREPEARMIAAEAITRA